MDVRVDINGFLSSRRVRMMPKRARLPIYGGSRRVSGVFREKAKILAIFDTRTCEGLEADLDRGLGPGHDLAP